MRTQGFPCSRASDNVRYRVKTRFSFKCVFKKKILSNESGRIGKFYLQRIFLLAQEQRGRIGKYKIWKIVFPNVSFVQRKSSRIDKDNSDKAKGKKSSVSV